VLAFLLIIQTESENKMDILNIGNEARLNASLAEQSYMLEHGEPFYCGFAWVEVKVQRTNSSEANALKSIGFKPSWKPKTLELWTAGEYHGQSMDVKQAGAQAYAGTLNAHGIKAYMQSRAD
jgi:hypothetical protein